MTRWTKTLLPLLTAGAALLAGCSSASAWRAEPSASAEADHASFLEVWGDEQQLQFSKKSQVRLPAKLAVVEVGAAPWGEPSTVTEWRRVHLVDELAKDRESYSDVVSLHGPGAERTTDLETLRGRAAQHQADLLLLVSRQETVEEGHNAWAALKILVLPLWLAPSEVNECHLTMRMAVMDVRNGLIYTTVDEVGAARVTTTWAREEELTELALNSLYSGAVEGMRTKLATKLRTYHDTAAEGGG